MFLYEKQYNIINVYQMKENKEAIKEYREKEMKKIPKGAEILCATTHYIDDNEITFLNRIHDDVVEVPFNFINGTDLYGGENKLLVSYDKSDGEKKFLLNKFYDGEFDKSSILKLTYLICDSRYLLLTEEHTKKINCNKEKMDNIIEIPKSLYTLQMFNKKRFDLIKNEDLSEILALYEISCFDEISLNELVKAEDYGINSKGFCDNLINTIKKDEVVIKKIKPLIKK